jgi:hypothetical protein
MPVAIELAPRYGVQLVAEAMGLSKATLSRRFKPIRTKASRTKPISTLTPQEEQAILDILHSDRFVDVAPAEAEGAPELRASSSGSRGSALRSGAPSALSVAILKSRCMTVSLPQY